MACGNGYPSIEVPCMVRQADGAVNEMGAPLHRTRLYLVRHAETSWNAEIRYQGNLDIPLSPIGKLQAQRTANFFSSLPLAALYSSTVLRAVETAQEIASQARLLPTGEPAPLLAESSLREMDPGEWTGLTREEAQERDPELFQAWLAHPESAQLPGGESLEDVRKRVWPVFLSILERHRNQEVVVVSHAAVMKVMICTLMEIPFTRFWQLRFDNCGVTLLADFHDRIRIEYLNETRHLDGLSSLLP